MDKIMVLRLLFSTTASMSFVVLSSSILVNPRNGASIQDDGQHFFHVLVRNRLEK